jgi:hypothetical protein
LFLQVADGAFMRRSWGRVRFSWKSRRISGPPSPALVEKDFQVVKALAAIAALETGPLQLVFGGGTA